MTAFHYWLGLSLYSNWNSINHRDHVLCILFAFAWLYDDCVSLTHLSPHHVPVYVLANGVIISIMGYFLSHSINQGLIKYTYVVCT